nr:hypothetical protein [Tanacetum cinerariifolium]
RNNSFTQQSAPTFDQLFEINDLKAQSQEKDPVIMKLKERLKSLSVVLSLTTASKLARWNLSLFKLEFTMLTLGSSFGASTMTSWDLFVSEAFWNDSHLHALRFPQSHESQ